MKLEFRYCTDEDRNYFLNLLIDRPKDNTYLSFYGFDSYYFDKKDEKQVMIVLWEGGCRVGFINLRKEIWDSFNQINLFFIVPEFRRKGYGLKLIQFGENYLSTHFQGIGTEVYTNSNKPMDRLLKKAGYKFSGMMKNFDFRRGRFYHQSRWYKLYGK